MRAASTFFYRRPYWYLALLLVPPLLWFGTVYLGSLFALLWQSFYRIDDFTAQVVREPTLETYKQLVTQPANVDIVLRTLFMAIAVTIACAVIALPIATYMARHASGRVKALFYVGVILADGPDPQHIKYVYNVSQGGFRVREFDTQSGSAYGHPNAAGAISVGASSWYATVPFSTSGLVPPNDAQTPKIDLSPCAPACLDDFSSAGNIPTYLDRFGNRLSAPQRRFNPSVSGPNGSIALARSRSAASKRSRASVHRPRAASSSASSSIASARGAPSPSAARPCASARSRSPSRRVAHASASAAAGSQGSSRSRHVAAPRPAPGASGARRSSARWSERRRSRRRTSCTRCS